MSVEHYYKREKKKDGNERHCAAQRGALRRSWNEHDFKVKNSVEHYYKHENHKICSARHCAALRGAIETKMILSLKTV